MDKKRLGRGEGERGGRGKGGRDRLPPYTLLTTSNISTKYPVWMDIYNRKNENHFFKQLPLLKI